MRKIIKLLEEAKPDKHGYISTWDFHTVLVEYRDNEQRKMCQMKVCMYPEEYEAEMIKQEIQEKYPDLMPKIEKMIELFREHEQNEESRNNAE